MGNAEKGARLLLRWGASTEGISASNSSVGRAEAGVWMSDAKSDGVVSRLEMSLDATTRSDTYSLGNGAEQTRLLVRAKFVERILCRTRSQILSACALAHSPNSRSSAATRPQWKPTAESLELQIVAQAVVQLHPDGIAMAHTVVLW